MHYKLLVMHMWEKLYHHHLSILYAALYEKEKVEGIKNIFLHFLRQTLVPSEEVDVLRKIALNNNKK